MVEAIQKRHSSVLTLDSEVSSSPGWPVTSTRDIQSIWRSSSMINESFRRASHMRVNWAGVHEHTIPNGSPERHTTGWHTVSSYKRKIDLVHRDKGFIYLRTWVLVNPFRGHPKPEACWGGRKKGMVEEMVVALIGSQTQNFIAARHSTAELLHNPVLFR